jgi:hypothetical protein
LNRETQKDFVSPTAAQDRSIVSQAAGEIFGVGNERLVSFDDDLIIIVVISRLTLKHA